MKNLILFDLDGTLAHIRHRLHFIQGVRKDWRGFFAACVDDAVIEDVARVQRVIEIDFWTWIVSGRSDECRAETEDWLRSNHIYCDKLLMRREGDHRPDEVVKAEWAAEYNFDKRVLMVFEDRARMVAMWRGLGITCVQVAEGNF